MNTGALLCIDTSTPVGSLALVGEGGLVASYIQHTPGAHTEHLFSAAETLLAGCRITPADLGGVAVAAGPGSFTGLRVAASTAKTLAWALGKPLYAAGSLKVLAFGAAFWKLPVCAVFDAGQNELYAACYLWREPSGEPEELLAPSALSVDSLCSRLAELAKGRRIICVGHGFRKREREIRACLAEVLEPVPRRFDLPNAAVLGELILDFPAKYRVKDILTFEPFYIRVGQAALRLNHDRKKPVPGSSTAPQAGSAG